MAERTNSDWLRDLSSSGDGRDEALSDLRALLERASLFCVRRRLGAAREAADDERQALAEDIAQEASLLILDRLDSFRGEAAFRTWAASFAVRLTMTALRRRLWRDVSLDRLPDGWQERRDGTLADSGWSNPQLAMQRLALWEVVREVVLNDLTPRQRWVLDLVVIQGVPTEQVEAYLGVTPSALYKTTHDARRKLKAGLVKRGFSVADVLGAFAAEG